MGALAGALGADQPYTVCHELTLRLTLTNNKTYDFKLITAPTKNVFGYFDIRFDFS
ncbi:hypothetical protein IV64_GL002088 [Lactiplantibacillus xiangfangensis]|uniref:Uncharacterized protein n=1 Tax=Lactiplantibacillus xiangfangensis TaxID=942150 RepID=A0A0R2MFW7_9LACO|nr:hypothetical protein IV64_GL002088 [Lactiplantibacillus xiangfangensis]